MKQHLSGSAAGVKVDHTLSMAMHHRGRNRRRWELVLLAMIGTVSVIFTFLTMFLPLCDSALLVSIAALLLGFFAYHADHPDSTHYTLLVFLLGSAVFFYWKRNELTEGLLYILNNVYQTIYLTDWQYFTISGAYDQITVTTMTLCFALIPIEWLLVYAVMRYQNFFLAALVTFPFVEVGFFFGIAPDHVPAAGLAAFWCGMGAVQLAAGSGSYRQRSLTGFVRRRAAFVPVPSLRFLLTESCGILTALLVFGLCMLAQFGMDKFHYVRPDAVKEMRTNFQYYAASIDWSDLSTIFPFLSQEPEGVPETTVELGRTERREFQNSLVAQVDMTTRPLGRTYLRYSTYDTYDRTRWRSQTTLDPQQSAMFDELSFYPQEFLFYTAQSLGFERTQMTLRDAEDTLAQSVPYGFETAEGISCTDDRYVQTATSTYTLFAGQDYENLLLNTITYDVRAETQLAICPETDQAAIARYLQGREDEIVQFPQSSIYGSIYYGGEEGLARRAEAAVLAACGYTDFAFAQYTAVPDSDEMREIYAGYSDLFEGFDARTATAAETMLLLERIRERLCAQVTYSLAPGRTPPGEDYIRFFLCENRKGYCTHYATAGTVLARMAGIPARYCEGYLVDGSSLREDGDHFTTRLLDSNAHAWTEIWIDGFGWVPFEFTFSYFVPPELPTEPVTEPPTEVLSEDPTEATIESITETAHVPLEIETRVQPTEQVPDTPRHPHLGAVLSVLGILIAYAGLVLLFVFWRRRVIDKREMRLMDPIGDAAAAYAWTLLLDVMARCGVNIHAGSAESLMQEAVSKCAGFLAEETLRATLAVGTKLRYSPHGLKETERDLVISSYRTLVRNYYDACDPIRKFWLKWIVHLV